MAVGIAAAIVFLIYFACIPVVLALKIRLSPKVDFGTGIAIFEGRFALRQAQKRMGRQKKRFPLANFPKKGDLPSALKTLKYLIRHTKVESLSLRGSIGMEDAAITAMICGYAEAAKAAVLPFDWSKNISVDLSPDFSGGGSELEFTGMFSVRAGHIICTALRGAVYLAKGRTEKWISTRLKI